MITFLEPGTFYLFTGPMYSGKSTKLIEKMELFQLNPSINYEFFKPQTDTRDNSIKSRNLKTNYKPIIIPSDKPEDILDHIVDKQVIAIDELQFFEEPIDQVILEIQKKGIQVVGAGLNLDFRGEIYNQMGKIIPIATHHFPLVSLCQYEIHPGVLCGNQATRTQRLINGTPAHYNDDQDRVQGEDTKITYGARCLLDHQVPGKPNPFKK